MFDVDLYLVDLKSKFNKIDGSKYYLSYSGGRDSHFLYWFIKEYLKDNKIKIVSCNTYLEHIQIRKRMEKYADKIIYPILKPFDIKEKYGIPCFSKMQDDFIDRYQRGSRCKSVMERIIGLDVIGKSWTKFRLNKQAKNLLLENNLHKISPKCCKYLKKDPFKKYEKDTCRKAILGVRSNESVLRKSKYKTCFTKDLKFTPIHDLTDELLDEIYEKYNIEIPEIYKYIDRTGCMGCPYGSYAGDINKELALVTEDQRKFIVEYFKESYDVLKINYKNIQQILIL